MSVLVFLCLAAYAQPDPWFTSHHAGWAAFERQWGPGWHVWSADAKVRTLGAPGVPADQLSSVVHDVAILSGVSPTELVLDRATARSHAGTTREIHRFERRWHGAVVEGDEIAVVITAGRIGTVLIHLTPLPMLPEPTAGERVLPLERGAVLATRHVVPGFIEWRDRSGEVVRRDATRRDATLTATVESRMPGDAPITVPARGVLVTSGKSFEQTDDLGSTTLPAPWDVTFDGDAVLVEEGGDAVTVLAVADGDLLGGTDLTQRAANFLHHYHTVKDWVQARRPDAVWMDEFVTANVDMTDKDYTCNAYYDWGVDKFAFAVEYDYYDPDWDYSFFCYDMARAADVVYHEAGHRIHHGIMVAGQDAGDISEGSADYISATITGDPYMAPGLYADTVDEAYNYIRRIDTDHVYPDDIVNEVHEDGLIWASFVWNLREAWEAEHGQAGAEAVDQLFLGTLELGPTYDTLWPLVLTADDDDGNLDNGTPNGCELIERMDAQGIGPGVLGAFELGHEPLGPQASETERYAITVTSEAAFPECGTIQPNAMRLLWTTDAQAPLPADGATDDAYQSIELTPSGTSWSGEIPRVPAGTRVSYYFEVEGPDGTREASHQGDPTRLETFWVGDRQEIWCDNLEGSIDGWTSDRGWLWEEGRPHVSVLDWEAGTPKALFQGDPSGAASGGVAWATNLDGDYTNLNAEWLLSPSLPLEQPGVMRTLQYQRWARVENGFYDRLGIVGPRADGSGWATLWTNVASVQAGGPMLDTAWTTHEVALAPMLAADGSHPALQLGFTLESDGGVTYSGWALDDVCVYELADPDGHYQVRDLTLEVVDGTVELLWTVPWVTPIHEVAVVRKTGSSADALAEEAHVVAHLEPGLPGSTMTWTDALPPAADVVYGVLLASDEDVWWGAYVDGENVASAPLGPEVKEEPQGCGCGARPRHHGALMAWVLGLLLVRRNAKGRA